MCVSVFWIYRKATYTYIGRYNVCILSETRVQNEMSQTRVCTTTLEVLHKYQTKKSINQNELKVLSRFSGVPPLLAHLIFTFCIKNRH